MLVIAVEAAFTPTVVEFDAFNADSVRPEPVEGLATAVGGDSDAKADATSIVMMTEPSLTLSPILMLKPVITPAWLEGISMDALSDSTVIRLCSALTVSPTLTSNSMTATSAKSPISGTLMSIFAMFVSLSMCLSLSLHITQCH